MYSVPKGDAPLVERLYWKNTLKRQRDTHKSQLESMFVDLMRPKVFFTHKTINSDNNKPLSFSCFFCYFLGFFVHDLLPNQHTLLPLETAP